MRHHDSNRKFGRVRKRRTALLRSLARSLILKERIQTTEAKAKELRPLVEKLVTKGKKDVLSSRRDVNRVLGGASEAMQKVFTVLAPRYKDRPGGYTRITKTARGKEDARANAQIEFIDN